MVYDFIEDPKPGFSEKPPPQNPRLPHIGDRIAAVCVDSAILSLLSSLVLAPLKKQIELSRYLDQTDEIAFAMALSVLAFAIVGVFYQAIFLWKRGATPGQQAFRLEVVTVWTHERLTFLHALMRAIFWWLDTLLVFPHLGILLNPRRRALHDRMADTMVISRGARESYEPSAPVVIFGRIALISFIGILIFVSVSEFVSRVQEMDLVGELEKEVNTELAEECEAITLAFEEWPDEAGKEPTRLSVAMSLFSAGILDAKCLEVETHKSFLTQEQLDLAYLAKAFSQSDEADLSDAYLSKVCEISSESQTCVFSRLIHSWTDKDWEGASAAFRNILPQSPVFIKIWAVKHFERVKDFSAELQVIEELWPSRALAGFLGSHRAVALWGLHRKTEARMVASTTLENMNPQDRLSLSSWFCYRELEDQCSSTLLPMCEAFREGIIEDEEALGQSSVAATYIRSEECLKGERVSYQNLMDQVPGEDASNYLLALDLLRRGEKGRGAEILKQMSTDEDSDAVFSLEARIRLVELAQSEEDLKKIEEVWVASENKSWERRKLGKSMFQKLMALGRFDRAFKIGQILVQEDSSDRELFERVVVAGYKSGDRQTVWNLLHPQNQRGLASAPSSEYEKVKLTIEEEFAIKMKSPKPRAHR